jgi:hypothetical protein
VNRLQFTVREREDAGEEEEEALKNCAVLKTTTDNY